MLGTANANKLLALAGIGMSAIYSIGAGLDESPFVGSPYYPDTFDGDDEDMLELEEHKGDSSSRDVMSLVKKTAAESSYDGVDYTVPRPPKSKTATKRVKNGKTSRSLIQDKDTMHCGPVYRKKHVVEQLRVANEEAFIAVGNFLANVGHQHPWIALHLVLLAYLETAGSRLSKQSRSGLHYPLLVLAALVPQVNSQALGYRNEHAPSLNALATDVVDAVPWLVARAALTLVAASVAFILTLGGRYLVGHRVKWWTLKLSILSWLLLLAVKPDPRTSSAVLYLIVNLALAFTLASLILLTASTVKTMILVPDPRGLNPIRSQEEVQIIQECGRGLRWILLKVEYYGNCRFRDIAHVVYHSSATILHVIAHGSDGGAGPWFQRDDRRPAAINHDALAHILAGKGFECVILNVCYSAQYSQTIADITRAKVIGWHGTVNDNAALMFSHYFYARLTEGYNIEAAYHYANDNLHLDDTYNDQAVELFLPHT